LLNNIFWIAGGRFKEETLDPLDAVIEKVAKAYVFGENKEIFSKYLENKVPHETHNTMEEALIAAKKDASNSHEEASILLAPAAASTDQFKNSEERGELFIKLVNSIE
jgi:UDP-N-acetylmuramoylalanine--D-glutamate ligase